MIPHLRPQVLLTEPDHTHHDIQNQLAIIQGYAELMLADTAENDSRRSDLEQIRDAAATALTLLADGKPLDTARPS